MGKRAYSLYQRDGKRWVRVSKGAYVKESAIRVFQDTLLMSCFNGWPELQLRPVKGPDEIVGELRKCQT